MLPINNEAQQDTRGGESSDSPDGIITPDFGSNAMLLIHVVVTRFQARFQARYASHLPAAKLRGRKARHAIDNKNAQSNWHRSSLFSTWK